MRLILTTINAKYIHTNRAIRLLTALAASHFDVAFKEFTIKESDDAIIDTLVAMKPDVLGISTYIWNAERFIEILPRLKQRLPNVILVAGGPEMSEDIPYYFANTPLDYIIKGEAEEVFVPFLHAIKNELPIHLQGVATRQHHDVERLEVNDLSIIPNIAHLYTDDDYAHRIIYLEASRGCPFHCSYCLASLSNGVRHFPFTDVQRDIQQMVSKGVHILKFLDRTMNAHPQRFLDLCDYVSQLDEPVSIQFEVSADILPTRVIRYLVDEVKPNVVRLEVGVQSIHEDTLVAVQRMHKVQQTLAIIKELVDGKRVVLHTDLIAGLPYENLAKFKESFNATFLTMSNELQLGFLKLLRGTQLKEQADLFGYRYDPTAPYEIQETRWLSAADIAEIKLVEGALESLWNRHRVSTWIHHLVSDQVLIKPYDLFLAIGAHPRFSERMPIRDLFELVAGYCSTNYPNGPDYMDDLKWDYVHIQAIKPIPFWSNHAEQLNTLRQEWDRQGRSLLQWQTMTKIPTSRGIIGITYQPEVKIERIDFLPSLDVIN